MAKAALWYGEVIYKLFSNKDENDAIVGYADKITALFGQEGLKTAVQEQIVSFTSTHLEGMNSLFEDLLGEFYSN